jgi:WD40 repeat protein
MRPILNTLHADRLRPHRFRVILILVLAIILNLFAGVPLRSHAQALKPLFTVKEVTGLDFSPDAKHLAVGLRDAIQIRSTKTGLLEQTLDEGVPVASWGNGRLDWNPSNAVLAVLQKSTIDLWDTQKGQLLKKLERAAGVIAWSADGHLLYIGGSGGLSVLDITTWHERRILLTGDTITALAASPDNESLVIAIRDDADSPKVIDSQTGKVQLKLAFPQEQNPIKMLWWSPDGKSILGNVDAGDVQGYTAVWQAKTGTPLAVDHILTAGALSWRPDGKQFAAVTYLVDTQTDQACAGLFDLKGKSVRDLCSVGTRPRFIVWSGDSLAIADENGDVYVIPDHS